MNHTAYSNPDELEIVTLENAVYMGMKNDLAFLIHTNIFLYEHQSTYNPNMPLRNFFYISREYQKFVDQKSLYSSTLQKIPAPTFIVFYNGIEKKESHWFTHLSEAYDHFTGTPNLELTVLTLNINEGFNTELVNQCKTLKDYILYVSLVRKYASCMDLNSAVTVAVDECIDRGILEDFLRKNRAEVIAMSIFEYDKKAEERKLRKAEFEAAKMEDSISLALRGLSPEEIADIVNVDRSLIDSWIRWAIQDGRLPASYNTTAFKPEDFLSVSNRENLTLELKKQICQSLFHTNLTPDQISQVLSVDRNLIQEWITEFSEK